MLKNLLYPLRLIPIAMFLFWGTPAIGDITVIHHLGHTLGNASFTMIVTVSSPDAACCIEVVEVYVKENSVEVASVDGWCYEAGYPFTCSKTAIYSNADPMKQYCGGGTMTVVNGAGFFPRTVSNVCSPATAPEVPAVWSQLLYCSGNTPYFSLSFGPGGGTWVGNYKVERFGPGGYTSYYDGGATCVTASGSQLGVSYRVRAENALGASSWYYKDLEYACSTGGGAGEM